MRKELELWHFISDRLSIGESVMLLVVAKSSGSSPGRAGYKMAVAADGELCGSIGGGVMEVNLVNETRALLSEPGAIATGLREQVHQKNSTDASGMICSGRQTVIFKMLTSTDADVIRRLIEALLNRSRDRLRMAHDRFEVETDRNGLQIEFSKTEDAEFSYSERLGSKNDLYIVGGGHCALALSDLISKLDFHITIFDDRPELNTLVRNNTVNDIAILEDYENIAGHIPNTQDVYVVIMTLGYASDKVAIKQLCGRDFKYFGVLGSKAKMAMLMKELKDEGLDKESLARIRTPIGIPINSRTPEEIAVSIAAEIISVKNAE